MEPIRNYPEWKHGDGQSLEEMARIDAAARAAGMVESAGPAAEGDGGGIFIGAAPDRGFWAKITAGDGLANYAWIQQQFVVVGGLGEYIDLDGGLNGAYDSSGAGLAREVNGNGGVVVGTRVWLMLADNGESWEFTVPAGGADPPPPGTITVEGVPGGAVIADCTTLQFHTPPFIVTQISTHVARVLPRWGDDSDVQPVGIVNDNGSIEAFSRVDHQHAAQDTCKRVRRITGPPPWTAPGDVCCDEEFWDGTFLGIWNCDTDTFVIYCPCITDHPQSGSGSGIGDCIPGICALCTDPPETWGIVAAGFTGDCIVFNGSWKLVWVAACEWKAARLVDAVTVTATLTLTGGGHTILFEASALGILLFSATYTHNNSGLPDCCTALTFAKSACACVGVDAPIPCPLCTETPLELKIAPTEFTGCLSSFNGTFFLTQSGRGCEWNVSEHGIIVTLIMNAGVSVLTFTDTNQVPPAVARYLCTGFLPDCLSEFGGTRDFFTCPGDGNAPEIVEILPVRGDAPGACPATLTATPDCCEDHPPPEPVCDCDQCVHGAPPRWVFTVFGATGDMTDANTTWILTHTANCIWTQTIGDITAELIHNGTKGWILAFTNNITGNESEFDVGHRAFRCCADNTFTYRSPRPPRDIGTIGDNEITLTPDGPCVPCGAVPNDCCPGVDIPAQLFLNFHNCTGPASCMNGTAVPLNWNGTIWLSDVYGCAGQNCQVGLFCLADGWHLSGENSQDGWTNSDTPDGEVVCHPLSMTFSTTWPLVTCYGGASGLTATVSE